MDYKGFENIKNKHISKLVLDGIPYEIAEKEALDMAIQEIHNMGVKEGINTVVKAVEENIQKHWEETTDGIDSLNKKAHKLYHPNEFCDDDGIQTRLVTPESYLENIGKYAWGYRGQQIAYIYINGVLSKFGKNE